MFIVNITCLFVCLPTVCSTAMLFVQTELPYLTICHINLIIRTHLIIYKIFQLMSYILQFAVAKLLLIVGRTRSEAELILYPDRLQLSGWGKQERERRWM